MAAVLEPHEVSEWRAAADGRSSELVLSWPERRPPPRRGLVTIRARASLGHLVHHWEFDGGVLPREGELLVVPEVPAEAQLDPIVEGYVVDLLLTVVIDGEPVVMAPAWLAWPEGLDAPPVVWTPELGATFAPHGVLDEGVVAFADAHGVEGRLLPPIVQLTSRPARPKPVVIDGLIDTGWDSEGVAP